jgi:thymidylate synthase
MFWKGVTIELLWFLRGDTNIKFLVDNGVNIWNEDAYNYYVKVAKKGNTLLSFDEFIDHVKKGGNHVLHHIKGNSGYILGDCGFQYGRVWRKWQGEIKYGSAGNPDDYASVDQIKNLITALKKNPESRRHLITAIDPAHENDLALYWCHAMFQFNCRPLTDEELGEYQVLYQIGTSEDELKKIPRYYLDCQLYQRSADVFLGVPFNIASYALLTHIIAKMCNMIPGDFIHTFGDVHIYDNHVDAVNEQLQRTPGELPKLFINKIPFQEFEEDNDLDKLFNSLNHSDFILQNYNPQPSIKAELSTGLKK